MFSRISPVYDRLNHLLSLNLDRSWRRQAIGMICPPCQTFSALDLCAGTFDLSLECLRQFPGARIKAVDFSQAMLNAGEAKIKSQMESGIITPICADAMSLPLKDESFDVIFCGFGVRNFDMTHKGVLEMYRVLKPGGQVVILEFFRPSNTLARFFHQTYARYLIPFLGRLFSGNDSAYSYLRDSIQGFLTVQEFMDLLKETKFSNLKIKNFFMSVATAVSATKMA